MNALGLIGLVLGILHCVYKKRTKRVKILNFVNVKEIGIFKKNQSNQVASGLLGYNLNVFTEIRIKATSLLLNLGCLSLSFRSTSKSNYTELLNQRKVSRFSYFLSGYRTQT